MTPQLFADNARSMHTEDFVSTGIRLRGTQHAIANEYYKVAGDRAAGEIYCRFYGFRDDGTMLMLISRYADRYIRTNDGWRIIERDPIIDWASPELMDLQARFPVPGRDENDPTYAAFAWLN